MRDARRGELNFFNAGDWKIGIVVAQFNRLITNNLLKSATDRAAEYSIRKENIDTFKVPGSIEIPLVLQKLAKTNKYDALLAIGCIIKGDTPHFRYVCNMVSEGVLSVQLEYSIPVGFGVLTCNNEQQAIDRENTGSEHMDAVLQQAKVIKSID